MPDDASDAPKPTVPSDGAAAAEKKAAAPVKKDAKKKDEELSEEDLRLKEELLLLVERAADVDPALQQAALETLAKEIKSSTGTMTSIPKALRFLRPHFATLRTTFDSYPSGSPNATRLADILSVLAMTIENDERLALRYKLAGSIETVEEWGHEYVRHLSGEVSAEYQARQETEASTDDLFKLIDVIVPYNFRFHAEQEACDLLLEVESLPRLVPFVDADSYERVGRYLSACSAYLPEHDDEKVLNTVIDIYLKVNKPFEAVRVALKIGDYDRARQIFSSTADLTDRRQIAYLLARHRVFVTSEEADEELLAIGNNRQLSDTFHHVASNLDILAPKTPQEIYKLHLEPRAQQMYDSARLNLASTLVNAVVNAGFKRDKLMTEEGTKWIYKNKGHAMMSATASLGMILLWDVETACQDLDKYLEMPDSNIKAGACLGLGIANCGVRHEADPVRAILLDQIESNDMQVKRGAIAGLGLACAGTCDEEVQAALVAIIEAGDDLEMSVVAHAALSLGLVFVSSCNGEIAQTLLETIMSRETAALTGSMGRYLCLGLGFLFLGRRDAADVILAALEAVEGKIGKYASLLVQICAYAGSGDVLKVQTLLNMCTDDAPAKDGEGAAADAAAAGTDADGDAKMAAAKPADAKPAPKKPAADSGDAGDDDDESSGDGDDGADDVDPFSLKSLAVLGIAMVAMSEEVGAEMAFRALDHLLQFGDMHVRRAIPLGLALLSLSHPRVTVTDTLSKLTHDGDEAVSQTAVLAMGLVGAGTNNSRISGLLRQLALYYSRDPSHLFLVRIAQGLIHVGKGALSLSVHHSDRFLLSPTSLAGVLVVLQAMFDLKHTLLGQYHYLLYYLATTMYPRMLVTVDEELKPVNVSVRVGQAVDTVGMPGHPKTITGFQTHNAPVLISFGERAELATADYEPRTTVLENVVIVKKVVE